MENKSRNRASLVACFCCSGNETTVTYNADLRILELKIQGKYVFGVMPNEIIADYELSSDPERDELLAREHTSVREVFHSVLAELDIDSYLSMGGVNPGDLFAVRKRLLG